MSAITPAGVSTMLALLTDTTTTPPPSDSVTSSIVIVSCWVVVFWVISKRPVRRWPRISSTAGLATVPIVSFLTDGETSTATSPLSGDTGDAEQLDDAAAGDTGRGVGCGAAAEVQVGIADQHAAGGRIGNLVAGGVLNQPGTLADEHRAGDVRATDVDVLEVDEFGDDRAGVGDQHRERWRGREVEHDWQSADSDRLVDHETGRVESQGDPAGDVGSTGQ